LEVKTNSSLKGVACFVHEAKVKVTLTYNQIVCDTLSSWEVSDYPSWFCVGNMLWRSSSFNVSGQGQSQIDLKTVCDTSSSQDVHTYHIWWS